MRHHLDFAQTFSVEETTKALVLSFLLTTHQWTTPLPRPRPPRAARGTPARRLRATAATPAAPATAAAASDGAALQMETGGTGAAGTVAAMVEVEDGEFRIDEGCGSAARTCAYTLLEMCALLWRA